MQRKFWHQIAAILVKRQSVLKFSKLPRRPEANEISPASNEDQQLSSLVKI